MPEFRPSIDAPAVDQMTVVSARVNPAPVNFGRLSLTVALVTPSPGIFTIPASGGVPVFSTTEFRPRKHALFDHDFSASAVSETPLIHYTTVWQRLSEYKSHDRVQVLTLWESSGSSVSIQAGKRGDPSLQWTSRRMNRGASTRGLLDRFFSASFAAAAGSFRNSNRSANALVPAKPAPAAVVAGLQ